MNKEKDYFLDGGRGSKKTYIQELEKYNMQLQQELSIEKQKNSKLEEQIKDGTLSDGYHTFNDLYYQRCILFATICNLNKSISWKSKRHNDGNKCFDSDNWFVVGIDTSKGSYTYHYEMKYWDLFKIQELEKGKVWDGHTEKDVTRLFSIPSFEEKNSKAIKEIKKELKENHHLSYGVALSIISMLNSYEDILDGKDGSDINVGSKGGKK